MRGHLCKVEDTQTADEVPGIGVVFDVADEAPLRPTIDAVGVDKVVCGSGKGVDLELVDVFLEKVADKLVNNEGVREPRPGWAGSGRLCRIAGLRGLV